ncbi:hypothetical protein AB6A40_009238 [Gnathostoma spinigerum]|uniref:Uncharacterized protein n=1 Tax=Gnathostoma spinigerum TaxID=75299 RepID=A0ABD6ERE0_9BILA
MQREDAPEHINTLRGTELALFALFVTICVILLTITYEVLMPVINNPDYPYYNYKPKYDWSGAPLINITK